MYFSTIQISVKVYQTLIQVCALIAKSACHTEELPYFVKGNAVSVGLWDGYIRLVLICQFLLSLNAKVHTVPWIVHRESWVGVRYDAAQSRYLWHNGEAVQRWPKNLEQVSGNTDKCLLFRPSDDPQFSFTHCTEERNVVCRKHPKTTTGKVWR